MPARLVGSVRHRFSLFQTYRSSSVSSRFADMLMAARYNTAVVGVHSRSSKGARVNFLCNSEKERKAAEVATSCPCIWEYLADLRASGGPFHEHRNPFYEPARTTGPIVPPAPALAPTIWPEFYLRWACPLESESVDREASKAKSKIAELKSLLAEPKSSHTNTSDVAKPGGRRSIRTMGSNVKD